MSYFNNAVRALLVWGWGEEEATLVGGWLMLCMVLVFSRPHVSTALLSRMPHHRQQSLSVYSGQTLNERLKTALYSMDEETKI